MVRSERLIAMDIMVMMMKMTKARNDDDDDEDASNEKDDYLCDSVDISYRLFLIHISFHLI